MKLCGFKIFKLKSFVILFTLTYNQFVRAISIVKKISALQLVLVIQVEKSFNVIDIAVVELILRFCQI